MLRFYNRIINTGVTDDLSFSNKLKTQLCNQSICIASTFSLIHFVETIIFSYPFYDIIISALWLILFGTCFYLNYKQLQKIGFPLLIIGGLTFIGIIHNLYGPLTRLEPLYVSITILGLFLLKKEYWIAIILLMLGIYFLNVILYEEIGAPYEEYRVKSAAVQYFIFSIILSSSVISRVLLENKNNHKLMKLQNIKMQEQNEELKRFNYIISHDLKEPIRSIVGLTGLLAKKNKGQHSDITHEIVSLGTRLNNMVNDIVKFQELDRLDSNTETFYISEVIENIKNNISDILDRTNAKISYNGVDEITGSKTCIYLILKNLIENGIKYNNRTPNISINCIKEHNNYSISITDNGIGIPEIYHEEVFVMFKRLNQLKAEKGSGLGLSISKKIAQKYRSALRILKSSDQGTTFLLQMPL